MLTKARRPVCLPTEFLLRLRALEGAYLAGDDPIKQSGFGGGAQRWRAERSPILQAVAHDGDFLDVGCANGYLLECLVRWAAKRGQHLVPYGLDISAMLIDVAKERLPEFASHLYVANAWDWHPPRRFRYVYALLDCVPRALEKAFVEQLFSRALEAGGRLIVGHYGSRSRGTAALPVADLLESYGLSVAGVAEGGTPPVTRFAWVDKAGVLAE